MPQLICHPCNIRTEKFYDFRIQVEVSDRTLRSTLGAENVTKTQNSEYYNNFIGDNLADANYEINTLVVPEEDEMGVVSINLIFFFIKFL